jgi:hypothetical protein
MSEIKFWWLVIPAQAGITEPENQSAEFSLVADFEPLILAGFMP